MVEFKFQVQSIGDQDELSCLSATASACVIEFAVVYICSGRVERSKA